MFSVEVSALLCAFQACAAGAAATYPNVLGSNAYTHHKGGTVECSGHLFALSGMDGATEEQSGFVGVWMPTHADYSLDFCALATPRSLKIWVGGDGKDKIFAATGDVLIADVNTSAGISRLTMAWVSDNLLAGSLPVNEFSKARLSPSEEWSEVSQEEEAEDVKCQVSEGNGDALALCTANTPTEKPFALARSTHGIAAAVNLAKTGICTGESCAVNLKNVTDTRLAPYDSLPKVSSEYQALLSKALSVMRVNTLSKEGGIRQHWTTPDRTPHRWMWLWDSCYHSFGVNLVVHPTPTTGVTLGWESVRSFLGTADSEGGSAWEILPTALHQKVDQTQPPLLAWAVWENYLAAKEAGVETKELLRRLNYSAPKLAAYLRWDVMHRGDLTHKTPLLCWSGGIESGMDNSPRFDFLPNRQMAAVDFSVFFARDASFLAKICHELGDAACESEWLNTSLKVSSAVHNMLWDEENGLYLDRMVTEDQSIFSEVKAVTGLLPMWLNDIPKDRVPKLLAAIRDPRKFGTKVPLASVARSTPSFSTDMWRGPMWINTNYMISLALLERDEKAEALKLIRETLDCVKENYELYGVIFEYYDSDGTEDPRTLMRKEFASGGVRDYHWSAALTFKMIHLLNQVNEEPKFVAKFQDSLLMRREISKTVF